MLKCQKGAPSVPRCFHPSLSVYSFKRSSAKGRKAANGFTIKDVKGQEEILSKKKKQAKGSKRLFSIRDNKQLFG